MVHGIKTKITWRSLSQDFQFVFAFEVCAFAKLNT